MEKEETEHLSFGKAYGVGVASYLMYQDPDRALFDAWLAYWPQIETEKKNQPKCFNAIQASFAYLDTLLQDYELVSFNGKPAAELSFRLDIDDGYYFVGHIDAILRHRYSGQHVVLECKHTGSELHDIDPLYKNSGQAVGYSIALDQIVGHELSSYGVLYFVAQIGRGFTPKISTLVYDKTLHDRLNWFITLGLDVKHLKEIRTLGIFPMRGQACMSFNRPCSAFGTCNLFSQDIPKEIEQDDIEYQFTYKLDDLIQNHIKRISSNG